MVALVQTRPFDIADMPPEAARKAIRELLAEDSTATRRVYAAIARKVWALLVERRFDPEIRDWHVLLNNVRTRLQGNDEAAAERVAGLADLIRESIIFAEVSPAAKVADRPRARAILESLAKQHGYVKRRKLMEDLEIGSSHLSNVLTQLQAHGLIERRGKGKEAEFEITRLGRELLTGQPSGPQAVSDLLKAVVGTSTLGRMGSAPASDWVSTYLWSGMHEEHSIFPARDDTPASIPGGLDMFKLGIISAPTHRAKFDPTSVFRRPDVYGELIHSGQRDDHPAGIARW